MNIGTEFELDLANELGLKRVAGSGNQWSSKLDVRGKSTRWSLKATLNTGFRIGKDMLDEAVNVVGGIGGTGETPIWAVRLVDVEDFIIMRKSDWIRFMKEEEFSIKQTGAEKRRHTASVPQLLREDSGN